MVNTPLHEGEGSFGADLVRALVDSQFPQWAGLRLRPVASTGTDTLIYRLGQHLAVRLPRTRESDAYGAKEQQWLSRIAPLLPVQVPRVVARGRPGKGYPWPWVVGSWLPGASALDAAVDDDVALGADLGQFLGALQRLDFPSAPAAGHRAGPLAPHDHAIRAALHALRGEVDQARALQVWEAALAAPPWSGPPAWVHGDLLPGNLLLRAGRLTGVIDWAGTGVGDPACDLMGAWSLSAVGRAALRATLDVDEATWLRAMGWTVEQAATFIPYYRHTIPAGVAAAHRRLNAVLRDHW